MSDKDIRQGLRALQAGGPEYASHILDLKAAKLLLQFAQNVVRFHEHDEEKEAWKRCRHCYPRLWKAPLDRDDAAQTNAVMTEQGTVISSSCKPGGLGHGWCANRNWTETSCSCECHCFVKNYRKR